MESQYKEQEETMRAQANGCGAAAGQQTQAGEEKKHRHGIATAGRDRAAAAEAMPRRVPATAGQPLTSAVRWPVRDRDMAVATDRAEVKAADKNADRDTDRDVVKADMAAAKGRHDVTLSACGQGKRSTIGANRRKGDFRATSPFHLLE